MNLYNQNIEEQIENYLLNRLSDSEKEAFEQRIASDEALRSEVEFQRVVIDAIRAGRKELLLSNLKKNLAEENTAQKKRPSFIVSIAALVLVGLSIGFIIYLNREQRSPLATESDSNIKEDSSIPGQDNIVINEPPLPETDSVNKDHTIVYRSPEIISEERQFNPPPVVMKEDEPELQHEDAIVRADTILSDIKVGDSSIKVYALVEPSVFDQKNKPKSSDKTEDKESAVVQEDGSEKYTSIPTLTNIHVEFWESPINFKGYKFFRNKLQLYGLQTKDISVLKLENTYYLKAGKELYILKEQNEFNGFVAVKNPEILKKFGL